MKNNLVSFTVGITTCYGEDSILDTVRSIRASEGVGNFRFIIIADRKPIHPGIKKILKKLKVELVENKNEGSQFKKKKQILAMCKSEVIVFLQDDIIIARDTLYKIIKRFSIHPDTTLISIKNSPVKPTTSLEGIINIGTHITNRIAAAWNEGDNYLSVIGRCEALRTRFAKTKLRLPVEVVSTDAFLYFENKFKNGRYEFIEDAILYFRNPSIYEEHLRKSSRFQHSKLEMSSFFPGKKLTKYYSIPPGVVLRSIIGEFISKPIFSVLYFILFLETRIAKLKPKISLNANWEVDPSTKKVMHV